MSVSQTFFSFLAVTSMILGVVFIFVDGMLLWSIGFFVIGIMIMLTKVIWNVSVWADNVTRRIGDREE